MPVARRVCQRCGRNRAAKFYSGPRGRICVTCRKRRVHVASRDVRLLEKYEITQDDYEAILEAQGGGCAICKGKRPYNLDVDHDHALERAGVRPRECVRGLLCKQHNRRLLPSVQDQVALLHAAIEYLTNPPARAVLSERRAA